MRPLLFVIACLGCIEAFSQEQVDVEKLLRPFRISPGERRMPADSVKRYTLTRPGNNMPNACAVIPPPKYVGTNSRGYEVYTLPVDNMPLIKPPLLYSSAMPVAGKKNNGVVHQ